MVRYPPPWYLTLHRRICAIPHFATYRAIIVRHPKKQARKNFQILPLQVSRDMKSIDQACADCPGFLVPDAGAAPPPELHPGASDCASELAFAFMAL